MYKRQIYVRGADKAGIKGTGKGATFVVDKTKPVFSSAIISSSSDVYKRQLQKNGIL